MLDLIGVIITSGIAIIGFAVSVIIVKKEYTNNLKVKQNEYSSEKMGDTIELINECVNYIYCDNAQSEMLRNKINYIHNKVYLYGSSEAAKIVSKIIYEGYSWNEKKGSYNIFVIGMFSLLISQLKYDLTGNVLNPVYWLKSRFYDYDKQENVFKQILSETIDEFDLLKDFSIK